VVVEPSTTTKKPKSSAAAEGFEVVRKFVEVETGKGADALDRRPQLKAALAPAPRLQMLDLKGPPPRFTGPRVRHRGRGDTPGSFG
jgi:hypothetical protein